MASHVACISVSLTLPAFNPAGDCWTIAQWRKERGAVAQGSRRAGNLPRATRIRARVTADRFTSRGELVMRFRESCLIALALWAVAGRAHAQTTVTKRTLTLEGAKAIAAAATAEATRGREGASIAVVDD